MRFDSRAVFQKVARGSQARAYLRDAQAAGAALNPGGGALFSLFPFFEDEYRGAMAKCNVVSEANHEFAEQVRSSINLKVFGLLEDWQPLLESLDELIPGDPTFSNFGEAQTLFRDYELRAVSEAEFRLPKGGLKSTSVDDMLEEIHCVSEFIEASICELNAFLCETRSSCLGDWEI